MPKIKRNVKGAPERAGFEPYDGPEPKAGTYRGKVTACRLKEASTKRQGIGVTVQLEAAPKSEHKKYDGYPAFVNIWLGEEEALQAREAAFYRAVTGKANVDDVDIIFDEDTNKVTKVGGKNPIGAEVLVELRNGTYNGEPRIEADSIYPVKRKIADMEDEADADVETEVDEDDEELVEDEVEVEDDEDEDEEDEEEVDREAELKSMSLPQLRNLAKSDYDLDTKGLKKAELVAAILEHESEDEDEDEEDDEPDTSEFDDRKEELGSLSRTELKSILKEHDPEFRVKKSHSDDDLVDAILGFEFSDAEDEDDDEDGDEPPF